MSVAIEVGAMAALIAATKKIKGSVFFVFSIVTLIQMIGNIFYCYQNINIEDELFKNWVELISPLLEMFGTDSTDFLSQHFFMKYDENTEEVIKEIIVEKEKPIEVIKEVPVEVIKEVIKEVPVEVIKEVPVSINNDVDIYDVDHDKDPKKINYTK
jgi:hypothetical protein